MMSGVIREITSVCKLRIGFAIMLSGLAGLAVTPGPLPATWKIVLFSFAILLSSASAGAFNQFMERDLDALMKRTRNRPFVTGRFQADRYWMSVICLMLLISVLIKITSIVRAYFFDSITLDSAFFTRSRILFSIIIFSEKRLPCPVEILSIINKLKIIFL